MDMDTNIKPVQLDLFSKAKTKESRRGNFRDRLSRNFNLSLENILVASIFITLAFLLFYSLGVEKGKRQAKLESASSVASTKEVKIPTQLAPVVTFGNTNTQLTKSILPKVAFQKASIEFSKLNQGSAPNQIKIIQMASAQDSNNPNVKGYAVQVATFVGVESAKREETNLRGQGYKTTIKTSGQWRVLYVGSFGDKQEAEAQLRKLKSKYHDCYIRRL
ncbi:MAG: SPOR domain-containing protein [Candidatus Omnitrophota bacterium]|nr:SPOR domain-containing protein [Candidatus Omnitrophota bacterium]